MTPHEIDLKLRQEPICRGCGGAKEGSEQRLGGLVCWRCFKYRPDCLKYFRIDTPDAGDVLKWLIEVGGDTTGLT